MAEPFSIATGVAQVAGTGFTLAANIYTYIEAVRTAQRQLQPIAEYVKLTSTALEQIAAHLRDEELTALYKPALLESTQEALTGCETAFGRLNAYLETLTKNSGNGKPVAITSKAKILWPWKQKELDGHQVHLERYKCSVDLLLTTLTFVSSARAAKDTSSIKLDIQRLMIAEAEAKKKDATFYSNTVSSSQEPLSKPADREIGPYIAQTQQSAVMTNITTSPWQHIWTRTVPQLSEDRIPMGEPEEGRNQIILHLYECAKALDKFSTTLNTVINECEQRRDYNRMRLHGDFEALKNTLRVVSELDSQQSMVHQPFYTHDQPLISRNSLASRPMRPQSVDTTRSYLQQNAGPKQTPQTLPNLHVHHGPPKKKKGKIGLDEFWTNQSLGSWADEMDALPTVNPNPQPQTIDTVDRSEGFQSNASAIRSVRKRPRQSEHLSLVLSEPGPTYAPSTMSEDEDDDAERREPSEIFGAEASGDIFADIEMASEWSSEYPVEAAQANSQSIYLPQHLQQQRMEVRRQAPFRAQVQEDPKDQAPQPQPQRSRISNSPKPLTRPAIGSENGSVRADTIKTPKKRAPGKNIGIPSSSSAYSYSAYIVPKQEEYNSHNIRPLAVFAPASLPNEIESPMDPEKDKKPDDDTEAQDLESQAYETSPQLSDPWIALGDVVDIGAIKPPPATEKTRLAAAESSHPAEGGGFPLDLLWYNVSSDSNGSLPDFEGVSGPRIPSERDERLRGDTMCWDAVPSAGHQDSEQDTAAQNAPSKPTVTLTSNEHVQQWLLAHEIERLGRKGAQENKPTDPSTTNVNEQNQDIPSQDVHQDVEEVQSHRMQRQVSQNHPGSSTDSEEWIARPLSVADSEESTKPVNLAAIPAAHANLSIVTDDQLAGFQFESIWSVDKLLKAWTNIEV